MNFGELKSHVQMMFQAVYDAKLQGALIEEWVNQGHRELDAAVGWTRSDDTDTSVAAQYNYSFPIGAVRILYVTYEATGENKATILEQINFEEWLRSSYSTGTPTSWCMWGGEVFLWPTPDTVDETITFYVISPPATMSSDATIPPLPVHLHKLIVDYALSQAYIHLGDVNAGMAYEQKYQDGVTRWIADTIDARTGDVRVVDVEEVS